MKKPMQMCESLQGWRLGKLNISYKILVDEFRIAMETTVGDASWINGNNEIHNRIIHSLVREGLLDSNER